MANTNVTFKDATGATVTHDARQDAAGTELRPVMVLGNDGDLTAGISGYGGLRVVMEPSSLFADSFDTAAGLDTVHRWTTGGTVVPTVVTGAIEIDPGTTAGASSSLASKPTFPLPGLDFLALGCICRWENVAGATGAAFLTGAHRFVGFGTIPGTWSTAYTAGSTTTNPLLNAIGFEIDTDGFMYPVVYDNGTRTRPALLNGQANLNVGRTLADGQAHQVLVIIRGDVIYWYLDGTENPVAAYSYRTTGFSSPDIATLPIRFHTLNGGAATGAAMIQRVGAVGVGDTGRNSQSIGDGTFPWRKAKVTDPANIPGAQQFATDSRTNGPALAVNSNAIQKATYLYSAEIASGVLTANTFKQILSMEHAANSTKSLRVRRVLIGAFQSAAPAAVHSIRAQITRGTAASSAGTAVTAAPSNPGTAGHEATLKTLPTITAGTLMVINNLGSPSAVTAGLGVPSIALYDWQEAGETIPLILRAGFLDTLAISVASTSTPNLTCSLTVIFTEE